MSETTRRPPAVTITIDDPVYELAKVVGADWFASEERATR